MYYIGIMDAVKLLVLSRPCRSSKSDAHATGVNGSKPDVLAEFPVNDVGRLRKHVQSALHVLIDHQPRLPQFPKMKQAS